MRRDRRSTRFPCGRLAKARATLDTEPLLADLDDNGEADRLIAELDALDGGHTEALIRDADRIIAEALALLDAGPADGPSGTA